MKATEKTSNITLQHCIETAKKFTARAKAVKAWRLRKADKQLQAYDMPKGYIIATAAEVNRILEQAGKKGYYTESDGKGVWSLIASAPDWNNKVNISIAPIR